MKHIDVYIGIACLACGLMLCACQSKIESITTTITTHITGEKVPCSYEQMAFFILSQADEIRDISTDSIWEQMTDTGSGKTLKEWYFEEMLDLFVERTVLNQIGTQAGIVLTSAQKDMATKAALRVIEGGILSEMGLETLTQADIESLFLEYMLALKVKNELCSANVAEVSESEARVMDVSYIEVLDENVAIEIEEELVAGTSYEELVSTYGELQTVSIKMNEVSDSLRNTLVRLEDGDTSDIVEEGNGYRIYQCIHAYNEIQTAQNKIKITNERYNTYLATLYADYISTHLIFIEEADKEKIKELELKDYVAENFFDAYYQVYGESIDASE